MVIIMDKQESMKQLSSIIDVIIKSCKKDLSTKDGYGTMLCIIEKIPEESRKNFVLLCIERGYPRDTGNVILTLIGN
jgi:hypothetical protein